jgi:acetolactate synthase I/II/III large subunit
MNGAESLIRTLLASGVDTCFANPGTSEMHFVSALDRVPGMRCVLGLAETVVTGAADGYGRMAGRPAATLLHCGAGLANGLSNLHNAKRARTPIVNIVGDHATWHAPFESPLASDVEGIARTMSDWTRVSRSATAVARDGAAAVQAARTAPGRIATLVLPADTAWDEAPEGAAPALEVPAPNTVAMDVERGIAEAIRGRRDVLFLLGGAALSEEALAVAARISAATGAALRSTLSVPRLARGRGRYPLERMPYAIDAARQVLADKQHVVLVCAPPPVGFFAYPGKPSTLWSPDATLHVLARVDQDPLDALRKLADRLEAPRLAQLPQASIEPVLPEGAFTSEKLGHLLAKLLPEQAVVVEDAVTSGRALFPPTFNAAPHDWLQITGGSIGCGMPIATGAAVASPGRKVINLQADGAGMYSLQALWTQARERLDVLTIVFSNRRYRILQGELEAVGAQAGPASEKLFSLADPGLDWVKLANGMGVEAVKATTFEAVADAMRSALARPGPFLIEFEID